LCVLVCDLSRIPTVVIHSLCVTIVVVVGGVEVTSSALRPHPLTVVSIITVTSLESLV